MSKNLIIIVILIAVLGGIIVVGQQKQQAAQHQAMELKAAEEAQKLAEAAQARQMSVEAEQARQKALEEARRAEEAAQRKAEEMKAKIDQLVTQARSSLNGGQYQQAINTAQNVLGQDANNAEAKSIIEMAKTKLAEAAAKPAEAVQGGIEKVLQGSGSSPSLPAVPTVE